MARLQLFWCPLVCQLTKSSPHSCLLGPTMNAAPDKDDDIALIPEKITKVNASPVAQEQPDHG